MMDTQTLLSEIEKFLKRSGMAASTFGHKTVGDGKLVNRLRNGRSVELRTAERILDFIAEARVGNEDRKRGKQANARVAA